MGSNYGVGSTLPNQDEAKEVRDHKIDYFFVLPLKE